VNTNQFSGGLPLAITSIILGYYETRANYFTGEIPSSFLRLQSLLKLDVSNNYLWGRAVFAEDCYPNYVNLSYNSFSGSLENLFFPTENYSQVAVQFVAANNNEFTGTVPNWSTFPTFYDLDVANNQLTGTLPEWNSLVLELFAASTNCFHGSIPETFCNLDHLLAISLNGLNSASHYQIDIFPNSEFSSTFTTKYSMDGGVPACLFSHPLLTVLQLSGNQLTGTLPDSLNISSSLSDLVLSHNDFTGTIPLIFQQKKWDNLDLSYNQFTGELSSSFHNYSSADSLTLTVNRLSGSIPASLLDAENIDILDGNLFACGYDTNNLPANDPQSGHYSCGSDTVNLALYFWVSILGLSIFVVIGAVYCHSVRHKKYFELFTKCFHWYRYFRNYCSYQSLQNKDSTVTNSNPLFTVFVFNQRMRQICILLTLFILVVVLPTDLVLASYNHSSYQDRFAWILSSLFFSGEVPGIAFFIELSIFIVLACYLMLIFWSVELSRFTDIHSITNDKKLSNSWIATGCSFLAVGLCNLIIMIAADLLYVYIIITYDTLIVTFAEIGLALLKIVWNNSFLWTSMKQFQQLFGKNNNRDKTDDKLKESEVAFIAFNISLNNFFYPIIAIMIVSSNCFYNAIFQAAAVTTSFSELGASKTATVVLSVSSSYNPPFTYSYQCSSFIYSYYCPVFLLMLLFESILLPVMKVLVSVILDERLGGCTEKDEDDEEESNRISRIEMTPSITTAGRDPDLRTTFTNFGATEGNQQPQSRVTDEDRKTFSDPPSSGNLISMEELASRTTFMWSPIRF
jgi:hypothetical protein